MKKYVHLERVSIEELTPTIKNLPYYIGRVSQFAYEFRDLPLCFGIYISELDDVAAFSPHFKLIKHLSEHNYRTEVSLKGRALANLLSAKKPKDSQIVRKLGEVKKLDRVILNLERGGLNSVDFNPAVPSDVARYLVGAGHTAGAPVAKNIILKLNDSTQHWVRPVLEHHMNLDPVYSMNVKMGVKYCPQNYGADTYHEFKPIYLENLMGRSYDLYTLLPTEYAGGIGPDNVYDALRFMANEDIFNPAITVHHSIMTDGVLDFKKLRRLCENARIWQKQYSY